MGATLVAGLRTAIADAGEHPNPKKRSLGQRLHRLEPDPETAPVVRRIFEMFAAGHGLKAIANALTADGVPSPSAHDRVRNPHRDPRGWAHSAVRTVLRNEKYLGRAVWGKQQRLDELFDVNDVAAGYVTRQRWASNGAWVYGPDEDHPPLIDQDLWDATAQRIAERNTGARPGTRSPRTTSVPYLLQGLLHCGICGRKMEGTTAHETIRYRCRVAQSRALPAYLADHPKSLYVREDDVVAAIDRWLPSLANPEFLAASQENDDGTDNQEALLKRRLDEIDQATRNLVSAIEQGTDPAVVQPRIAELRAERSQTVSELAAIERPDRLTSADIAALLAELGGMEGVLADALPAEKADIYASLGLRLQYRPDQRTVEATADLDRVLSRVGGGT